MTCKTTCQIYDGVQVFLNVSFTASHIPPAMSMVLLCSGLLFLLSGFQSASGTFVADMDYGGVPLWINRLLGEPSVLSLQGRMDPAWFRANNPQLCPEECDCPIQWPTALYCDQRALAHIPDSLPDRTQYLFLQVGQTLCACVILKWSSGNQLRFLLSFHYNIFYMLFISIKWQNSSGSELHSYQGNNISTLSSSVLANVTGLRWLILDNNQLESDNLTQDSLQSQTQLWYFFANHNHLSSVPSALPAGLKQLRLAYNQISSINPEAFQNLHSLTLLLLQGNRLNTITEGDLRGSVMCHFLLFVHAHFTLNTYGWKIRESSAWYCWQKNKQKNNSVIKRNCIVPKHCQER